MAIFYSMEELKNGNNVCLDVFPDGRFSRDTG